MSGKLTRDAYAKLIEEDIEWLRRVPYTLERDHILLILKDAVRYEYDAEQWRTNLEQQIEKLLVKRNDLEFKYKKVVLRCIEGFSAIRDSNLERGHQAADEMLKILRGEMKDD